MPSVLSLHSINKEVFAIVFIAACKHDFIVTFTYICIVHMVLRQLLADNLSIHLYVVYFLYILLDDYSIYGTVCAKYRCTQFY